MGPLPRPPRRCQRGLKIASYTPSFPNPRQQYSTPRCPAHCITSFGSSPTTFAQSSFTCAALLTSASPLINRTASTVHAVRASRIPRTPTPASGRKASISSHPAPHGPPRVPIHPSIRPRTPLLLSHPQHHVIPEPAQLVVIFAPLQSALDPPYLLPRPPQFCKQLRIDEQFLFFPLALPHQPAQFHQRLIRSGFVQLHRCMVGLLQGQTAYVPDEDVPALLRHPYRLLQYLQQIIRARKILHDRIQDNQIHTVIVQEPQLMRHPFPQLHMTQIRTRRQVPLQLPQHLLREINSGIAFAACSQPCK